MNISESFAEYMEDNGFGTTGQSLFIADAPKDGSDSMWWIVAGGGAASIKAHTGEKVKQYIVSVFYRDLDPKIVYDQLQAFEELINTGNCDQLTGFDTIEMEATQFATDQDIESEDRTVGLVQVTITVYQS